MVNLKKITALSMAAVISLSTPASADLATFIQNNLDASVTSENSGYYVTQARGYYTLGSMRVRWGGLGTVHPFNMQAPSINVGCSGIDMVFGGFSYLNFEYLVDKLKKISSAAPAFAFKMAISTLCKDCDTIMTELEKIANSINSMSFDTCKMSQQIGGWSGRKIGNAASDLISMGSKESWLSSHESAITNASDTIQSWINSANNWMNNGGEGAKEQLLMGSLVDRASNTYGTIFGNDDAWKELIRSFIGDIYGYMDTDNNNDGTNKGEPKILVQPPIMNTEEFIEVLLNGDSDITVWELNENISGNIHYKPKYEPGPMVPAIPPGGLKNIIKNKIIDIVDKIQRNESLSQDDINFINAMPVPIYRIINVIAVLGNTGLETTSEYLALKEIDALIRKLINEMMMYIALYKSEIGSEVLSEKDMKFVNVLLEKAQEKRKNLNEIMIKIANNFKKQTDLVDYYLQLEKQIRGKSPIWAMTGFGS